MPPAPPVDTEVSVGRAVTGTAESAPLPAVPPAETGGSAERTAVGAAEAAPAPAPVSPADTEVSVGRAVAGTAPWLVPEPLSLADGGVSGECTAVGTAVGTAGPVPVSAADTPVSAGRDVTGGTASTPLPPEPPPVAVVSVTRAVTTRPRGRRCAMRSRSTPGSGRSGTSCAPMPGCGRAGCGGGGRARAARRRGGPTKTKIAYLVGEGLSNPDIAARLLLSRNTVQVHMSKILAKLQVRSRLEVAMAVARRPADTPPTASRSTA